MLGSAMHDSVTEVYHVLEGSGTLVTGGTLTEPERRGGGATLGTSDFGWSAPWRESREVHNLRDERRFVTMTVPVIRLAGNPGARARCF